MRRFEDLGVAGLAAWLFVVTSGCGRPEPISEIKPSSSLKVAGEIAVADGDWPWWSGSRGDGDAGEALPVTEWTATKNVLWSADVPGRGHSTPIVVGDIVVLTTADEARQRQEVIAYNRDDGAERWRTTVHEGRLPKMHPKNSHASATLGFDGTRLFAAFIHDQGLYVTALTEDGEIAWQTKAGAFRSEHGYGSSPLLHESLVIVNGDNLDGCFVAALHRESGELVWRTPRPTTGRHGSFATPTLTNVNGVAHIVLSGMGETIGYDAETGEQLWRMDGPAEVTAGAVAAGGGLIYASGGYPEKSLLAIRPAESPGESAEVVWEANRGVTYVPSPLLHEDRLYVVNDQGVATCFDALTGERVWQQRLAGSFSASPVLAEELILVTNESGRTFVFRAADEFELVAENELESGGFASPVICGGKLYLRTDHKLYCFVEETET